MTLRNARIVVMAGVLSFFASHAVAQQPARPVSGGDERTVLVGGGLTFMNVSESTGVGGAVNVLFNALKTNDTGRFGIVGDFGVNGFDGGTVTTVMGGGRFTFNTRGKVVPYGQVLVGISHCCSDTDFVPALGGGVDIAWLPELNFRGEIQFVLDDPTSTRFLLGVSLPIRK